jgi:hypothetical protein
MAGSGVKAHNRVKGGVHCGRSMAWERGSAAPMARQHERRQRRCRRAAGGRRRGGENLAWWASSACLAARGLVG